MRSGRNIPQFLDADAVGLRIEAVELFSRDEIFGKRAARAFCEHGNFGAQFVAGSEIVLGAAVLVAAFIVGDDTGDAVAFIDELRAGKLREDVDARLLDQAAEPLDQFVERDDVVAVIAQRRRRDRQFPGIARGKKIRRVGGHRRFERRGLRVIGNQFGEAARIHHGSRKLVRAEFAALF